MSQPISAADPDLELARGVASGQEDALRALYARHGRRLFAYALRLTGNRAVAEEVLQDSLLAVWRAARHYRGEGRVIAWLLGIVHHQALNAQRRKKLPAASLDEALDVADHSLGPEGHSAATDRQRVLAEALARLSLEHQAALELVFYQGLSLAEVSQVCRCPLGTVKSRLNYAKAHLRRALEQAGLHAEDLL